jgi:hypothetical protein
LPVREMTACDLLGEDRRDAGPTRLRFVHDHTSTDRVPGGTDRVPGGTGVPPVFVTESTQTFSFGKHVCTGTRPKCSTCPLLEMCQQVGVTSHR